MKGNIYFDALDTDRTKLGADAAQANEWISRGEAELKMSILCGAWTPVFPQTCGWDSAALLGYGAEESFESIAFLWLVRNGHLHICLRDKPSIWDAALSAFDNPEYRRLSAWPEFNTDNPYEDRRPLVEAMRTGKPTASLPVAVQNRLLALRKLSDAAKDAPPSKPEHPRGTMLSTLIRDASAAAQNVDPKIAALLSRCVTEVPNPDNRTSIDTFLETETERVGEIPPEVRDITNACFNAVSAVCLDACPALTSPVSHPKALEILLRTLPGSVRGDRFEAYPLSPSEIPQLTVVGWDTIQAFEEECGKLSASERIREAEAARLIAKVNVERSRRYVLMTRWTNILYNAAVWGAAGALGLAAAGVTGPIASVAAVTAVSALAGGSGSLDVRGTVKEWFTPRLERKLLGLLHRRYST